MYVSDSVVCSSALLGNDPKGINLIKWHDFFLIRLIKNRKFMEYLNEDLESRLMSDFKFYKGSSFTRTKNDEYFTWSEILYGSILKINGATHKNIQCIHIQLFGTKRLKLVPFLIAIINEALPHPSGRETFSLPHFHIFCTAATLNLRCCFYIRSVFVSFIWNTGWNCLPGTTSVADIRPHRIRSRLSAPDLI